MKKVIASIIIMVLICTCTGCDFYPIMRDKYGDRIVIKEDTSDKNSAGSSNKGEAEEKNTEKNTDKNTENNTDKNTDKNTENNTEKNTENNTEKSTENNTDGSTEKKTEDNTIYNTGAFILDRINAYNNFLSAIPEKQKDTDIKDKTKTDKEKSDKDKTDKAVEEEQSDIKIVPVFSDETNKEFSELAPTVNMSFEELVGDNGNHAFPKGYPAPDTYKVVVDLYHQVVIVYKKAELQKETKSKKKKEVVYEPYRYMLCSSGADDSQSPTGTFKMKSYRVRFGLFNNTESYAQYWSLIVGRIYFHSILYSERDASAYTSASWRNLGDNASHGCIRLTVPDARWIWYNIAPDTEITIRRGSSKDAITKAIRDNLVLAKLPSKRVKLKAGKVPYTDNWKIEDVPNEVEFVQGSQ